MLEMRADLVGGVWLPEGERHLRAMLLNRSKTGPVDGKATYQLHKLQAAMAHQPADRRRVCLDIGAHVGLWSMHLVKLFAEVHAFEPVPLHAEIFPRNVATKNVTLHRVALGARAGTVSLSVPEESTGNAQVLDGHRNPHGTDKPREVWHGVAMRSLDGFGFARADLVKIDVEGFELPVVQGARETLLRCRPNVVLEQKGNEAAYGQAPNAALDYLRDLGMTPLRKPIGGDWILGWPE